MMRFHKISNYSYDKKRFLRIQRQSRELIIPLAFSHKTSALGDFAGVIVPKDWLILTYLKGEEAPARVAHGGGDEGDRLVVEEAAVRVRAPVRHSVLHLGRSIMNYDTIPVSLLDCNIHLSPTLPMMEWNPKSTEIPLILIWIYKIIECN